jgi:hypothetical protein
MSGQCSRNRPAPRVTRGSKPLGGRRSHPWSRPATSAVGADPDAPSAPPSVPLTVLKVAGSLLGPATVLTALMYYFGLLHAFWFFSTFGVDYTVFGLTTQDYLTRSADGLFVPLTAIASAGLAILWGYRLLAARLSGIWRVAAAPVVIAVLAVLGVALLSVAVTGFVAPDVLRRYLALPGMALSAGVVLLMAASRAYRWLRHQRAGDDALSREPSSLLAAEWAAVFLLISVGLFWAAGDWSAAVGTRRGNQVLASLKDWPDAVLYSNKRLNPSTPGVRETRCHGTEGESVYRYDGMHLIVQSGGQYLFLPTEWQNNGHAIVVPKTNDMRLVFTAHGASRAETC